MKLFYILHHRFVHRHGRKVLMTYSESYDLVVLTIPNSALYLYPEPRNCNLKLQNNYQRGFCWFLGSSQLIDFTPLNDDCSAQGRGREPNVVWLEPHGHKASAYVIKSFYHARERNSNRKQTATTISTVRGRGAVGHLCPQW
jgi:hypothetical protein